jgi:hypothetical protein
LTVTGKPSTATLRTAAELRAAGNVWEKVADDTGYPIAVVKTWPHRYRARWQRELAAAERRALADATAEAILMLRKQLRSEDASSVREAAGKLVQIRVALERAAPTPPTTDSPPGFAERLVRYVQGKTREELAARLDSERRTEPDRSGTS